MTPRSMLISRIGLSAALALLTALGVSEGRRYVPYLDAGGVPTVCDGVTGPDVIPGKRYTDAECDDLLAKHADYHAAKVMSCIKVQLSPEERVGWVHFAYNVGGDRFCASTAAKMLNADRHEDACRELFKWYRAGGMDCRDRANKCPGLIDRRQREFAWCSGRLRVPDAFANVIAGSASAAVAGGTD